MTQSFNPINPEDNVKDFIQDAMADRFGTLDKVIIPLRHAGDLFEYRFGHFLKPAPMGFYSAIDCENRIKEDSVLLVEDEPTRLLRRTVIEDIYTESNFDKKSNTYLTTLAGLKKLRYVKEVDGVQYYDVKQRDDGLYTLLDKLMWTRRGVLWDFFPLRGYHGIMAMVWLFNFEVTRLCRVPQISFGVTGSPEDIGRVYAKNFHDSFVDTSHIQAIYAQMVDTVAKDELKVLHNFIGKYIDHVYYLRVCGDALHVERGANWFALKYFSRLEEEEMNKQYARELGEI